MDFEPLIPIEFYVVGSTVRGKADPADLDLVGVIPNDKFRFYFGMDHKEFQAAFKEDEKPDKLKRWKAHCIGAKIILESIFPYRKVDIKIISESMLYAPNQKVSLWELDKFK